MFDASDKSLGLSAMKVMSSIIVVLLGLMTTGVFTAVYKFASLESTVKIKFESLQSSLELRAEEELIRRAQHQRDHDEFRKRIRDIETNKVKVVPK